MSLGDLPEGLTPPTDDGAADHLAGRTMPPVTLGGTSGDADLSRLDGTVVIYCYPMTGTPGRALPTNWDDIPGARGCTPQSCAFRDHAAELAEAGVNGVIGISTQTVDELREAKQRLELPYELLSDADGKLAAALRLPTFDADGKTCLKRLTMVLRDGQIERVLYPVFPPDRNAADVLDYLRSS